MTHRILSMDLLRACAILLVLVGHAVLSYGAPKHLAPLQFGGTGVDLFFVLSGWLLGCQLFKELKKNNKINIKKFWTRRWMRTIPAYYAVLCFSVAQQYFSRPSFDFPWEYFIFIQNYYYPLEFFSISWSLSVEEQFYLAIAPLVAFSAKLKAPKRTLILITVLVLPLIFRQLGWSNNYQETHVRWDGCVMGVLLAHLYYSYPLFWQRLIRIAPTLAIIALLMYIYNFYAHWNHDLPFRNPDKLLLAFMFGSWVLLANSGKEWATNLYLPGAQYIATRSYAMYLLHPEALALLNRLSIKVPFVVYLAATLVITLLLSELLYRIIEKPSMDIREKFSVSKHT
jgi:peptidoglycan/LPS O-acetylase OafA/YrhL